MRKRACSIIAALSVTLLAGTCPACSKIQDPVELRDALYTGLEAGSVRLTDGKWEGERYVEGGSARPRVGLLKDFQITGDLTGDGNPETVVILWESSAGTGSYTYVAVMSHQGDTIKNIGTALIGDRVKLRDGKIENGELVLDVLQAGENDAMCCPTILATRSWTLEDGQLKEGKMKVTGKLPLSNQEGVE